MSPLARTFLLLELFISLSNPQSFAASPYNESELALIQNLNTSLQTTVVPFGAYVSFDLEKLKNNSQSVMLSVNYEVVDTFPPGKYFQFSYSPDVSKSCLFYSLNLSVSPEFESNAYAIGEANFLRTAIERHYVEYPEMYVNSKLGSDEAKIVLERFEEKSRQSYLQELVKVWQSLPQPVQSIWIDTLSKSITARVEPELSQKEHSQYLSQIHKISTWKSHEAVMMESLEKSPIKLDDLVAKNDRAGVAKLLKEYLPWPLMEPSEIRFWQNSLDAIEHPSTDKLTFFRGLADDHIGQGANNGSYIFSSLLAKNQGNYTRRLRSLETMRERHALGNDSRQLQPGKPINFLVSKMMQDHAGDPLGSPFISLTPNPDVAITFALSLKTSSSAIAIVNISRNRITSNFAGLSQEMEMLVPFILFPDELMTVEKMKFDSVQLSKNYFPGNTDEFTQKIKDQLALAYQSLLHEPMSGSAVTEQETTAFLRKLNIEAFSFVNSVFNENCDQLLKGLEK